MYFTSLPDHSRPGFDETLHFSKFRKYNIIFNALSARSHCDNHVGCLSFKTVLSGEEWYGINHHRIAVRPGSFLILNDDQAYSCNIDHSEKIGTLSVFFKKEFASAIFRDALYSEAMLLDEPLNNGEKTLEFFQTLHSITPVLQQQLSNLITTLDNEGYNSAIIDERLVFFLHELIRIHRSASRSVRKVDALKSSTRTEIYRRLCVAKDILQSSYMDHPDLNMLSHIACLSVPQLVRQFKAVFHTTPYKYLIRVRLEHAAKLLKQTDQPVHEITWRCGFENTSAFCRAFRTGFGMQPVTFRKIHR